MERQKLRKFPKAKERNVSSDRKATKCQEQGTKKMLYLDTLSQNFRTS